MPHFAQGFVIVRDDTDAAYYLDRDGVWRTSAENLKLFTTTTEARQWIRKRALGYWLGHVGGPARVISARAAGVLSK